MGRLPPLALVLALLAAGCSTSPCQDLGERLCSCTGSSADICKTQVEEQLKTTGMADSSCEGVLAACNAPAGTTLCEWLLTADGKRACGLATPEPAP